VIRAVIDTNVLVSALISPSGNEALIVLAIQQGLIKPYFSGEILDEYAGVLARPKFGFPQDEIDALLALLESQGESVHDQRSLHYASPDPEDEKFIACAKAAEVDFIVTGNKRDFPPEACETIQVINAAELLDRITLEI
jgi:putative PIN family toxin of toxin-antitoxin system